MIPEISNALQVLTHTPNAPEKSAVLYGIIERRDQMFWMIILLLEIRKVIVQQNIDLGDFASN